MRPAHRHVTQTRTRALPLTIAPFPTRRKFSTHLVTASSVLLSQDKQPHVPLSAGRAPGCRHGRAPSGGMQRRKSSPSTSTPWNKRRLWRRFRAPQQSRCPPCTTSVPRARGPKLQVHDGLREGSHQTAATRVTRSASDGCGIQSVLLCDKDLDRIVAPAWWVMEHLF